MHLRLPRIGVTSVENSSGNRRIVGAAGKATTIRGPDLLLSPRIRTAPQFPHFNSTVGLGTFECWRRRGHTFNERRSGNLHL